MWLRPAAVAASDAERRPPGLFLGSQRQADYKRLRLARKNAYGAVFWRNKLSVGC